MGALDCRELTVHAGGRVVLDRVSLQVADGCCCVVMGPSGAGKSTLLAAVAGLVPHEGTVAVDGRVLAGVALHRRGVGLLFQQARLFPSMSALDNVAYPLRVRGTPKRQRRAAAARLLDEVGLADRLDDGPGDLSGGERQRVALARALCSNPEVLLLDEPLTGLDLPQRRDLAALLGRVRRERCQTWVIVTHDPEDAVTLGDHIAVLDRGELVQHDLVDAVAARPRTPLVAALLDRTRTGTEAPPNGSIAVAEAPT
jgi:ABC-type Fe3+/spermidine/putrescine transport system ATPase subunit